MGLGVEAMALQKEHMVLPRANAAVGAGGAPISDVSAPPAPRVPQPARQLRVPRRANSGLTAGAQDGSVMYLARWTVHSSVCSMRIAPTRRRIEASFGKMPTTSVRRLISPFSRSIGLVLCSLVRCWAGKVI